MNGPIQLENWSGVFFHSVFVHVYFCKCIFVRVPPTLPPTSDILDTGQNSDWIELRTWIHDNLLPYNQEWHWTAFAILICKCSCEVYPSDASSKLCEFIPLPKYHSKWKNSLGVLMIDLLSRRIGKLWTPLLTDSVYQNTSISVG